MSFAQRKAYAQGNSSSFIPTAVGSLAIQAAALATIAAILNEKLDEFIVLILAACKGRDIFSRMSQSGIVGKKIAVTLASTGTPSFYFHSGEALHGDLGINTSDDHILLISIAVKPKKY